MKRFLLLAVIAAVVLGACSTEDGTVLASAATTTALAETVSTDAPTTAAPATVVPTTEAPTTAAPTTTEAPKPTTTTAYVPTAEDLEMVYLIVVRAGAPLLAAGSDRELVDLGHLVCDAILEAGGNVRAAQIQLAVLMTRQGNDYLAESAGTVFGAAIPAFCPEYSDQIG